MNRWQTVGVGLLLMGCSGESAELATSTEEIQNGATQAGDWMGVPLVGGSCSGILLRSNWVLTAKHCSPTIGGTVTTNLGGQTTIESILEYPEVAAPELYVDVKLLKLTGTLTASAGPFPLFRGPPSALQGQSLECQGWGYNNVPCFVGAAGWTDCTGFGTLRSAIIPVAEAPEAANPGYFTVSTNALSQIQQGGDSGGPCLLASNPLGRSKHAGVLAAGDGTSFARILSAHRFRDWATGLSGAAPSLGDHAGFERADGFDAVIYQSGGRNRELSNVNGTWIRTTLPGTTVASTPALVVYPDGASVATYRDTSDKLRESYRYGTNSWKDHSISNATPNLPTVKGNPAAYIRGDTTGIVVFRSSADRIIEVAATTVWTWSDLSDTPSATLAASDPIGLVRLEGSGTTAHSVDSVVYRDVGGAVAELRRSFINGPTAPWIFRKLNNPTSNGVAAPLAVGTPRPFSGSDGFSGVVYRSATSDVWLLRIPQAGGAPAAFNLSSLAGAGKAAGDPTAFVQASGKQAALYVGTDNHIRLINMATTPMTAVDLSTIIAPVLPVSLAFDLPVTGYVTSDRSDVVLFRENVSSNVIEMRRPWGSNSWFRMDLTQQVGGL